jgi:hypothetical protein
MEDIRIPSLPSYSLPVPQVDILTGVDQLMFP